MTDRPRVYIGRVRLGGFLLAHPMSCLLQVPLGRGRASLVVDLDAWHSRPFREIGQLHAMVHGCDDSNDACDDAWRCLTPTPTHSPRCTARWCWSFSASTAVWRSTSTWGASSSTSPRTGRSIASSRTPRTARCAPRVTPRRLSKVYIVSNIAAGGVFGGLRASNEDVLAP